MRFKISRLVRNQGISRRMGLVKTVGGKFFHLVKNFGGYFFRNTVFDGTFGKHGALFRNFIAHFLTHNFTQFIGAA